MLEDDNALKKLTNYNSVEPMVIEDTFESDVKCG